MENSDKSLSGFSWIRQSLKRLGVSAHMSASRSTERLTGATPGLPTPVKVLPTLVKTGSMAEHGGHLIHDDLILRMGLASDYAEWLSLRQESHDHLTQWEPDWAPEDVTKQAFQRRLKADKYQMRASRRFAFLVFQVSSDAKGASGGEGAGGVMVGGMNLSDIRLGNRRSGVVGYWVAEKYARQGIGTKALAALCGFAFETLELNRLEAACQAGNVASRRLLEAAQFQQEGIARDYLKINGAWRDHEIWALTKSHYRGNSYAPSMDS